MLSFHLLEASARVSGNGHNRLPLPPRGVPGGMSGGMPGGLHSGNNLDHHSLDHTVASGENDLLSIELHKGSSGLGLGLIDGLVGLSSVQQLLANTIVTPIFDI